MKNRSPSIFFQLFAIIIVFYICNRISYLFSLESGNIVEKVNIAFEKILPSLSEKMFFISLKKNDVLTGLCGAAGIFLFFLYHIFNRKKYMHDIEYGSSEWGTRKDIKGFIDKDKYNNIIFSKTERLSMKSRVKKKKFRRNKNVIVVGGPGSGKTEYYVKPNGMQLHSSYVFTDPKGTLIKDTGKMYLEDGFKMIYFNTINFLKSMHYNPLAYIKSEKDILTLVNVIIVNTKGEGDKNGEDFWVKAEKLLYQALIGYLYYEAPLSERNLPTMIDLLECSEVKEDNEDYQSPLDILFEELEEKNPDCFPVKQYKKFKKAAGKTLKSILISCAARLAPFDIKELREITSYDELRLDEIGDHKTVFYIMMRDNDDTFSFLIAMIFYQMFNLLCDKADDEYGGRLPYHVRCIIDETANIGKIPKLEKIMATIRSREISATLILQSLSQLKSIYKDDAETIIDCCDTLLFLGGKSTKSTETVSKMIGKTTIDNTNINESIGQSGSYSLNNQKLGRDLIDPSEIGRLEADQCLVMLTGKNPFKSMKYNIEEHPRYKLIGNYNEKNYFDFSMREKLEAENFMKGVSEVLETDLTELNALI